MNDNFLLLNPLSLKSLTMEAIIKQQLQTLNFSDLSSTLLENLYLLGEESDGKYNLFSFSTSCYNLPSGKPLLLYDGLPEIPKKIEVSRPEPGAWRIKDMDVAYNDLPWKNFSFWDEWFPMNGWRKFAG